MAISVLSVADSQRRGRGVSIVLAHEDHRQLLHAGEVERFVKRAVIDRAVAEERHGDLVGSAGPRAQAQSDRRRQSAAHEAVGAEQSDGQFVKMHAAAAPAAAAAGLAIELGQHLLGRHALGQRVAVAAVRAGNPIVGSQMRANPDRRGFLADVEVNESRHFSLAIHVLRGQLEAANEHHLLVQSQQARGVQNYSASRFGRRSGYSCAHGSDLK